MMGDTLQKDLIIIGAGLNGLSAGLAYALNNPNQQKKVLILEKNPISGGYVTSFTRQGFQFDTTQMISNITDILDYFGIRMEFYNFTDDYIRVFKADPVSRLVKTFELSSPGKDFEEQFIKLFPDESAKLKKFFAYSEAMFHEIYGLKYAPGFMDVFKMLFTCPKVLGNMNKTFSQYLKMFGIDNPEVDLLFQVFSSMCGLPNERIAALLTVGVMYSLREKAYRPGGPFIELPQKMEQRFSQLGGEIRFKCEVEKILVEKGCVKGVQLKDGTIIRSRSVISTVDVKTTIKGLVGLELVRSLNPRYAKNWPCAKACCHGSVRKNPHPAHAARRVPLQERRRRGHLCGQGKESALAGAVIPPRSRAGQRQNRLADARGRRPRLHSRGERARGPGA